MKRERQKKEQMRYNEYKEVFSKVPRICVDLILNCDERIFIGKRAHEPFKNKWAIVGGRIFFGESIESSINRILEKEVGVKGFFDLKAITYLEFLNEIELSKTHSLSIVFSLKVKDENEINFKGDSTFLEKRLVDISEIKKMKKSEFVEQHLLAIESYKNSF